MTPRTRPARTFIVTSSVPPTPATVAALVSIIARLTAERKLAQARAERVAQAQQQAVGVGA